MHCPDTDRRLTLEPGQETCLHVRAGTLIVCADGSIVLRESRPHGGDDWGVLRPPAPMPLCGGQGHRVEQPGLVCLRSERGARLYCIAAQAPWVRFWRGCLRELSKRAIVMLFRRGVEQSGSSSGS